MHLHDRIVADLQSSLPSKRFLHVMGVLQAGLSIAKRNNLNSEKIEIAALLHDCAKGMDRDQLNAMRHAGKFQITPEDEDFPAIWHGPAAGYIARETYGITDPEILDAITHHTVGHTNPSPTLRALMAADSIEPTRDYEGLADLRRAVKQDLRTGLLACLKEKVAHVESTGRKPHSRIYETIASLEAE